MKKKVVLITGASGLIGKHISNLLFENNFEVIHLVRKKNSTSKFEQFIWNVKENFIEIEALKKADCIIHLAGEGIADKPWTTARKKEIIDSRVLGTDFLLKNLSSINKKLDVFVAASAIGFYGLNPINKPFEETDKHDSGFLGDCCYQWEKASSNAIDLCDRFSIIRIGIVLANEGGALPKLLQPIKYYIGSALGSGKQTMPWIHIEDLCRMFLEVLVNTSIKGIYNAVSPNSVSNNELTKEVAKVLERPLILPNAPEFIIKLIFGELSQVVLNGAPVSAKKICETGFQFKFPKLNSALTDLLLEKKQ
jgi:uncharacterized protein (TIGR01777 family)